MVRQQAQCHECSDKSCQHRALLHLSEAPRLRTGKLAAKKDCDVQSFEVKELVNEYDFVSKQLYQMDDLTQMMLEMAQFYLTDRQMQDVTDKVYGEGTSEFFGLAFRAFYSKE